MLSYRWPSCHPLWRHGALFGAHAARDDTRVHEWGPRRVELHLLSHGQCRVPGWQRAMAYSNCPRLGALVHIFPERRSAAGRALLHAHSRRRLQNNSGLCWPLAAACAGAAQGSFSPALVILRKDDDDPSKILHMFSTLMFSTLLTFLVSWCLDSSNSSNDRHHHHYWENTVLSQYWENTVLSR